MPGRVLGFLWEMGTGGLGLGPEQGAAGGMGQREERADDGRRRAAGLEAREGAGHLGYLGLEEGRGR